MCATRSGPIRSGRRTYEYTDPALTSTPWKCTSAFTTNILPMTFGSALGVSSDAVTLTCAHRPGGYAPIISPGGFPGNVKISPPQHSRVLLKCSSCWYSQSGTRTSFAS